MDFYPPDPTPAPSSTPPPDTATPTPPPPPTSLPYGFVTTMTTAMGTVAALTWTDAFRSLFAPKGMFATSAHTGPWLVAVIVTCLALMGINALNRFKYQVVGV